MSRATGAAPSATGLDVLAEDPAPLAGKRVALLVNHTSVTTRLEYSWSILPDRGIAVAKIFSPEHGLFGAEQDQDPVFEQKDIKVPLVSLYGDSFDSLLPDSQHFEDIDALVYDIQDVGSRYYTYLNTMIYCMKRLSGTGIELVVLDRPNPLGGEAVEGPLLAEGYESFVGVVPVPVRHGLTAGEMALFARDWFNYDLKVTVIKMQGWERKFYYNQTRLPWVFPSPNMPTPATALVYPGMCLLEGTNVSEGRGSTTPFELFGAPFLQADRLKEKMAEARLDGVVLRRQDFRPTFNKHGKSLCQGLYIHVTDRSLFRPFSFGVHLTAALHDLHEEFTFARGVYEFNDTHPAFDLLAGSSRLRQVIEEKKFFPAENPWRDEETRFLKERKPYLLYHDT